MATECEHRYVRFYVDEDCDIIKTDCAHCHEKIEVLTKTKEEDTYGAEKIPPSGFQGW